MKVLTDRGILELDIERIALEILASKGKKGLTIDAIASEIERRYHTVALSCETISKILQPSKFARFDGEKWYAPENAHIRLVYQRAKDQAKLQSNRYKVKVRYTKKGCARIIVPKPIIEKLGSPTELYIMLSKDTVRIVS